ncbi:hypothetical protein ACFFX0_20405 [Citricoccus parietis]|uniref:Uncharacterized protein n=1 Tax=Citricoccus parietis TaxID=592307 RepID=A0ABV5G452_9MICC
MVRTQRFRPMMMPITTPGTAPMTKPMESRRTLIQVASKSSPVEIISAALRAIVVGAGKNCGLMRPNREAISQRTRRPRGVTMAAIRSPPTFFHTDLRRRAMDRSGGD